MSVKLWDGGGGVNPSLVPVAFFCVRSCSTLTLGRGTDSSLPRGDVEDPWSRSRAASDVSWHSAGAAAGTRPYLRKNYALTRGRQTAVGMAPAMAAPHLTASDTSKTTAWSSEENYPRGIICSASEFLCSS